MQSIVHVTESTVQSSLGEHAETGRVKSGAVIFSNYFIQMMKEIESFGASTSALSSA